jgi:putative endonuclease
MSSTLIRWRCVVNELHLMRGRALKQPCVYILASGRDGVLYVGVTSDLVARVSVHKQDLLEGFTKRYAVHTLVYYEMHETMDAAIRRETQIKKWNRAWKIRLIKAMNPEWRDLFDETWGAIEDGPADEERFRR